MARPAGRTGIVATALLALLVGCGGGEEAPGVEAVLGAWQASAGRWEGRVLEIGRDSVVFHRADGSWRQYPLEGVESELAADGYHYTLRYRDGGAEASLSVVYRPAGGGAIYLNRAEGVAWHPVATDGDPDSLFSSEDVP